jgi:hypothetical protein
VYLEIDEGFDEHPKTVRLCRVMRDVNAGQYLIRLWAWACRSAQDGDLSGMESSDVEIIAKYKKEDGKLFTALTEVWSQKFGPWIDHDGGKMVLHGWCERTGLAIKKMEGAAQDKKLYRLHRDGKCDRTSCKHCSKEVGQSSDSPRTRTGRGEDKSAQDKTRQGKTSPDKTSPDKTSQDPEGRPPISKPGCKCAGEICLSPTLCAQAAVDEEAKSAAAEPTKTAGKVRPRTAHELETCLRAAIQREQCTIWSPGGHFAASDGRSFLEGFGDQLEDALPDIEAKIEMFAKDKAMSPWTVRKFVDAYNGIGKVTAATKGPSVGHYPAPKEHPTKTGRLEMP